ncbi:MAG TPA: hypothetical protein VIL72_00190 [Beijerinckiaceae bacterium]
MFEVDHNPLMARSRARRLKALLVLASGVCAVVLMGSAAVRAQAPAPARPGVAQAVAAAAEAPAPQRRVRVIQIHNLPAR